MESYFHPQTHTPVVFKEKVLAQRQATWGWSLLPVALSCVHLSMHLHNANKLEFVFFYASKLIFYLFFLLCLLALARLSPRVKSTLIIIKIIILKGLPAQVPYKSSLNAVIEYCDR